MAKHRQSDDAELRTGNYCIDWCNICHQRRSIHSDDFYGYHCNVCHFKHPMRRRTNPFTGAKL